MRQKLSLGLLLMSIGIFVRSITTCAVVARNLFNGNQSEFVLALDADMSVPQRIFEEMICAVKDPKYMEESLILNIGYLVKL